MSKAKRKSKAKEKPPADNSDDDEHLWTETELYELIDYVHANRGLWKYDHKLYHNNIFKSTAFKQMGEKMGNIPGPICQKKWGLLKKAYRREKKLRSDELSRSGNGGPTNKTGSTRKGFAYYNVMTFLDNEKTPKTTLSNLPPVEPSKFEESSVADALLLSTAKNEGNEYLQVNDFLAIQMPDFVDHSISSQLQNGNESSSSSSQPPITTKTPASSTIVSSDRVVDLTNDDTDCGDSKAPLEENVIKEERFDESSASDSNSDVLSQDASTQNAPNVRVTPESSKTDRKVKVERDEQLVQNVKIEPNPNLQLPQKHQFISPWLANAQQKIQESPTSCYSAQHGRGRQAKKDPVVEGIIDLTQILKQTMTAPSQPSQTNNAEDSFGNYVASELKKMSSPEKIVKKRKITAIIYENV